MSGWVVRVERDESPHTTVTVNGELVAAWKWEDGTRDYPLPSKFGGKIHIHAIGKEGVNSRVRVYYNGREKKNMSFDGGNGEDHDLGP